MRGSSHTTQRSSDGHRSIEGRRGEPPGRRCGDPLVARNGLVYDGANERRLAKDRMKQRPPCRQHRHDRRPRHGRAGYRHPPPPAQALARAPPSVARMHGRGCGRRRAGCAGRVHVARRDTRRARRRWSARLPAGVRALWGDHRRHADGDVHRRGVAACLCLRRREGLGRRSVRWSAMPTCAGCTRKANPRRSRLRSTAG